MPRLGVLCFLILLALPLTFLATASGADAPAADHLAGKPPFRRLFLSANVVEESAGLTRIFHAAEKYRDNPVLVKEHPWEGWTPYLYGTVLRDGQRLRMWYQSIGADGASVLYAESSDGIKWDKPRLGLVAFEGSKDNNILLADHAHIASVMRVAAPKSPAQAWAMFTFGGELGPRVLFSPDGLSWQDDEPQRQRKLFTSSDVLNVFYDPYRARYVAMYKTAAARGHRAVGVATSPDALTWTKPTDSAVFCADDLDPDATQVYGMPVFCYQGLYIGTPWIYHARYFKYGSYSPDRMNEAQEDSPRTVDVQLAWSHDLVNWTRTPERKPFIALGPEKAFDSKMIFTARAPVVVGDELYFYYGGFDRAHDDYKGIGGGIGLARLRLDGFCSMHAGEQEGWLISRREVFKSPRVTINARTAPGGRIAAELIDRKGRVVPGFGQEDCIAFTGDSVRGEIRWKSDEFPPRLRDQDRRIRFILKNADLYSYLPADVDAEVDDGFPDP